MLTHEFSSPIPPGTVRISVIIGGDSYTVDLPSDRISDTLTALEDHAGPMTADRCMVAAAEAAGDGDAHVVTAAALWLYLFQPVEGEINGERLAEMIATNGSAMLTAMVCETSGAWTFKLFAMPRWPTTVRPYSATERDRRRRWR